MEFIKLMKPIENQTILVKQQFDGQSKALSTARRSYLITQLH